MVDDVIIQAAPSQYKDGLSVRVSIIKNKTVVKVDGLVQPLNGAQISKRSHNMDSFYGRLQHPPF